MEPGRFQFAIRMLEGEMEVATSAAGYISEPGDAPSWLFAWWSPCTGEEGGLWPMSGPEH